MFFYFVEGVFISMVLLLTILIIRAKTPRRWIVEQITIEKGTSLHEVVHIGKYSDFKDLHNEKMIDPNLLFRMPRTFWKMPYYFLANIRARFAIVYLNKSKTGLEFQPSKIPANIINVAETSTAYQSAVNSTFNPSTKLGGFLWVVIAFAVIVLIVFALKGGNF